MTTLSDKGKLVQSVWRCSLSTGMLRFYGLPLPVVSTRNSLPVIYLLVLRVKNNWNIGKEIRYG